MANPYPSGLGEKRDLSDAQGPNTSPEPIYDRAAKARENNAKMDPSIVAVGNQDGAIHLERSMHDMKDMPEVKSTIAWGNQDGSTDMKRSI
jgi:hypothetical protein